MLINITITIFMYLFMEGVAWFTHKFIMHGFLWNLHKDHHAKEHDSFFEKNDYFFLIFAIPGIVLLAYGLSQSFDYTFFLGLGITLYGFSYFFIHDLFIHQRFKILRKTKNKYLSNLRRAHKLHHKNTGKYKGEYFGMLYIPRKFNKY
jgi:beta-carotene 3-hydroxylase